jgi:TetR/AcrR family transcriptional regulator
MGTSERKQREKAKREEEIVAKAKELFLAKGYENTTVDEIADSLEISKGILYTHFSSKEELFFRVIREGAELMYDRFKAAMDGEEYGIAKFGAIGLAYMQFWNDHPEYVLLLNQPVTRTINPEPGPEREMTEEIQNKTLQLNVEAIQRGKEDGSIRGDLDPMMTAFIIGFATRGILEGMREQAESVQEMGFTDEGIMKEVMKLFGRSLEGTPVKEPGKIEELVKKSRGPKKK